VDDLDQLIHQATRLRIMTLLHRNRQAATSWVQDALGLTPGNLASHVAKLQAAGYVQQWMALTPGGFESHLRITPNGAGAFSTYLAALQAVLEAPAAPGDSPPVSRASAAQKKRAQK
jgi:DNA-binding MarR family transcriptional regulator